MSAAVWPACVPEPTPRLRSGLGQAEVAEEDVRHRLVVVLAGVDEPLGDAARARAPRMTGAAFMKFGRAPTTCATVPAMFPRFAARVSGCPPSHSR